MDLGLRDHVILVTGGAKGIGAQVANVLAAEGLVPTIIGHNAADNAAAVAAIVAAGNRALAVEAELTDTDTCRQAVDRAAGLSGRIDGLVNNAGVNDAVGLEMGDTGGFPGGKQPMHPKLRRPTARSLPSKSPRAVIFSWPKAIRPSPTCSECAPG